MVDAASLGLAYTLGYGCLIFAGCLFVFEILRRKIPTLYYYRNYAAEFPENTDVNGVSLGTAPLPGAFWPSSVLKYPLHTIRETHGLEAAMFLRLFKTMAQMFAVLAIFTSIVLLPTFGTASNKNLPKTAPNYTTGVATLGLGNVEAGDNRLWVLWVADLMIVLFVCAILLREARFYCKVRREYRTQCIPANYAILVMDIPAESQNNAAVFEFFDNLFPGSVGV
jgi:Late exocytosis, associated with Golgi transport